MSLPYSELLTHCTNVGFLDCNEMIFQAHSSSNKYMGDRKKLNREKMNMKKFCILITLIGTDVFFTLFFIGKFAKSFFLKLAAETI